MLVTIPSRVRSGGFPRDASACRCRSAKIFQPFNPLKGFEEALRQKEREAELAALEGDGVSGVRGQYEPEDVPHGDVPWGDAASGGA